MSDLVRWAIQDALPEAIDNKKRRRLLHALFWPATVLMSTLIIAANGVFGMFVIGAPLLIAGLTWRIGLARVPTALLVLAGFAVVFPAGFLGLAKRDDMALSGLPLVGLIMFVVWVSTYPTLLGTLNQQYLERAYPGEDVEPDEYTSLRVLRIKLWMTAVTTMAVGDGLAAFVAMFALWHRHRWSAWVAWFVCVITPFLLSGFTFTLHVDLLVVVTAAFSARTWLEAARHPVWEREYVWR